MKQLRIADAAVYTGEEVVSPATIVVAGDAIREILPGRQQPAGEQEQINAAGRLVTPGLVNAHTHAYSALARGMALRDAPPTNFVQILERLWWRLDRALTLDDIELSARLHALECLRAGVTTIFDHHASQRAIQGSLGAVARGVSRLGLRACLAFEVSDREGPEAASAGIAENLTFAAGPAAGGDPLLRARFGLHASFTLSDATLLACAEAAGGAGFHVHVAEAVDDQEDARRRGAVSALARLERCGILSPHTLCIHGVHLDEDEVAILAASGAWLVHCPESNMNNAVGGRALEPLLKAGVRVALGSDGFTADILREALCAHLLQNQLSGDPGAGYRTVPALPLAANASLASETFGLDLGRLLPGCPADLVVWDYLPPTPLTGDSLWGHLQFGLVGRPASEVVIAGRRVLSGGRACLCDEDALAAACRKAAAELWERF